MATKNKNNNGGGGGGGGFFPFKVQDLVSVVTDAIDAFDASHDPIPREYRKKVVTTSQQQKQQVKKTGEPGRPTRTNDVIMEDAPQQQQKQPQQQNATPNNNKKETSSNIVTPKKEEAPPIYFSGIKKVEPELVSDEEQQQQQQQQQQPPPQPIVEFAKEVIEPKTLFFPTAADLHSESNNNSEHDWEILSEREHSTSHSYSNGSGGEIFVPRAGSIRSIASIDEHTNNSSSKDRSVPFKIQRTLSSSTIDSQDNALGPSGLGVLGVDYVEHIVLPTDTLQGICIAYKVSASSLRRANHFTGHKIHSAPKKLLIPLSKQALRTGFIRVQDTDSKEYKLHYFQAEFPNINMVEAKAYLELADWDLKEALQSAKADREWQKEEAADSDGDDFEKDDFKGGQIGVKINFRGSRPMMKLRGIGRAITSKTKKVMDQSASLSSNSPPNSFLVDPDEEEIDSTSASEEDSETKSKRKSKQKVIVHSQLPPIATKSAFAEDLYNAAPEHCNYGLELKPITKRQDNNNNNNNNDNN